MRRWGLLLAGVLLALYVAYPYVTLWRLDQAILKADIPTLNTLIDWPELRQRLKAEAKLALIDKAQTDIGQGGLGGLFGGALTALLVPTVVDSAVDATVTPEALVHNDKIDQMRHGGKSLLRFVTYAFFASPAEFRVDLKDPDEKDSPTLTTLLELRGGRWQVVALKLPPVADWFKGRRPETSPGEAPPSP
jgi:Protein of unknown function (DUF2939)